MLRPWGQFAALSTPGKIDSCPKHFLLVNNLSVE